ncbi:MAG TPA: glucose 1-dehydrogenase [Bryobacteraceae bacterium]|nr:glucose 1-dehydrogenase [Bryobacteraceae bacterium]
MPDPLDRFSLRGRIALITGGGSGLGFAIASAMIAAGARVAITGRREEVLKEAAAQLGPCACWYMHDVTDAGSEGELLARIEEDAGTPGILVNNAGVHLKKEAVETSDAEFQAVLDTHVAGSFRMTRAVLPGMIRQGKGSVLFLASMTSLIGMPKVIAYSAAKAAYLGMVRSLASEVAAHGIRVNAIAPGWIETPMLRQALSGDRAREAKILGRTPMGRFGEPADIGWAAVYLCSDAAAFVNGIVLPVDGGASMGF